MALVDDIRELRAQVDAEVLAADALRVHAQIALINVGGGIAFLAVALGGMLGAPAVGSACLTEENAIWLKPILAVALFGCPVFAFLTRQLARVAVRARLRRAVRDARGPELESGVGGSSTSSAIPFGRE